MCIKALYDCGHSKTFDCHLPLCPPTKILMTYCACHVCASNLQGCNEPHECENLVTPPNIYEVYDAPAN